MDTPQKASRRNFLLASAATATTLAGELTVARSAHAQGSERFRVALIGAGGRGTGASADCLRAAKHVTLVAVADAFEDRALTSLRVLKERFGDQVDVPTENVLIGLDAYQKAIACEPDLVILTTPPGFRPMQYRAAIEAGKHVFMEKPVCVDPAGYRSVMETNKLADHKQLKVGVGMFRRHMPKYLEAMQEIHDGAIGPIQSMRCYCNMVAWGAFERRPDESELEYQVRNWRVFDWLGGGRLVEAHCHELDVMDWAMQDHPVECNGMGGRTALSTDPRFGQDYDHHFHEYTYADGTKMHSQCRQLGGAWSAVKEHIHGAERVVDLDPKMTTRVRQMFTRRGDQNDAERNTITNPYHQEHIDLLDAIWNSKPYNEGWHGATSSFSGILGREASYSGQVVKWDDLVENGHTLFSPEGLTWETEAPVKPDANGSYAHLVPAPGIYKAI